ncbi:hypothetical protein QAD02_015324 [Eretmocerus hayati]|uniref:Uncharacterized protein n=1 Tax=Eretmocerus hayati TaxID=131215 RepID=A0ACC2P8C2_9HYME|nr:hypothetical protein QAD02_015324 [Eretmocerus hayati]
MVMVKAESSEIQVPQQQHTPQSARPPGNGSGLFAGIASSNKRPRTDDCAHTSYLYYQFKMAGFVEQDKRNRQCNVYRTIENKLTIEFLIYKRHRSNQALCKMKIL